MNYSTLPSLLTVGHLRLDKRHGRHGACCHALLNDLQPSNRSLRRALTSEMLISNRISLEKTLKRSPPAMYLTWTHTQHHQDRSIPSSTCSDKEQLRRDRFATRYQASSFAKAWYSPLPLGVLAPLHLPRMIRKSS